MPHGKGVICIPGTGLSAIWTNNAIPCGIAGTANNEEEKCLTTMKNGRKNGPQRTWCVSRNEGKEEYTINYADDQIL